MIGAPDIAYGQAFEGAVFVHRGSAAGLSVAPTLRLESDEVDGGLGRPVSVGADIDGLAELLVGSNTWSGALRSEGAIFLYEAP